MLWESFLGRDLVVGSGLDAVQFAYDNDCVLIQNLIEPPHRFDFFDPGYTLPFNIPNEVRVLTGDTDTKVVGAPKHLLWERLLFELSIEGRLPLSDKVATIRIKSKNELSITTRGNKKIDLVAEKIHLMDPRKVIGSEHCEEVPTLSDRSLVLDWFSVRSGCVHEFDFFEGEDNFINQVYFYPSDRIAGNHNKKDLVAISHLTSEELGSSEYSIVPAMYKTLNWMKSVGIKGQSNGRDPNNPLKRKYYAIRIEHSRRQVIGVPELG